MQYMGGKYRQSRGIVECIRPYAEDGFTYVEPFCGGMWSAARVCMDLHPGRVILNDVNRPLMLLWDRCLEDGVDWLPGYPTREEYELCKSRMDEDDPITAYYGFGFSFGGRWFKSYIKPGTSHNGDQRKSIRRKVDSLRPYDPELRCESYEVLDIPDGAVVYCDPPYEGRTKAHHFDTFDYGMFWDWVRDLSTRCTVFTSCFEFPGDFREVYRWGDTVVRHNHGHGHDGTCERMVVCDAD